MEELEERVNSPEVPQEEAAAFYEQTPWYYFFFFFFKYKSSITINFKTDCSKFVCSLFLKLMFTSDETVN